ncbi:hypothetical protein [Streptomyces sp. NPDC057877]|uniref:hypothetical protein n=1 Tax=Streptomyces sp. NPDC057877 TaxID=3346269 RepID=UPI0036C3378A
MGMKAKLALGVVVGVAVIGAVSANGGGSGNDSDSSGASGSGKGSSSSSDAQTTKKDKEGTEDEKTGERETEVAFEGSGDFQVGSDVQPGTYRTTGNTDGLCYWERAKDASGELDSLLANDNVSGTAYVTVKATDKLFKSSDCGDWEAVDPKAKPSGSPATTMDGDGGMFRVGTDIAPGTYKSTGNTDDMCYWERAKDAEHALESIIANDNVSASAVVTIKASDAYFKTSGCTEWKKTG